MCCLTRCRCDGDCTARAIPVSRFHVTTGCTSIRSGSCCQPSTRVACRGAQRGDALESRSAHPQGSATCWSNGKQPSSRPSFFISPSGEWLILRCGVGRRPGHLGLRSKTLRTVVPPGITGLRSQISLTLVSTVERSESAGSPSTADQVRARPWSTRCCDHAGFSGISRLDH